MRMSSPAIIAGSTAAIHRGDRDPHGTAPAESRGDRDPDGTARANSCGDRDPHDTAPAKSRGDRDPHELPRVLVVFHGCGVPGVDVRATAARYFRAMRSPHARPVHVLGTLAA